MDEQPGVEAHIPDMSPSRVGGRAVALPGIERPPGRGGKDNSQALSYGAGWQAKLDSGRAPNKQTNESEQTV